MAELDYYEIPTLNLRKHLVEPALSRKRSSATPAYGVVDDGLI